MKYLIYYGRYDFNGELEVTCRMTNDFEWFKQSLSDLKNTIREVYIDNERVWNNETDARDSLLLVA